MARYGSGNDETIITEYLENTHLEKGIKQKNLDTVLDLTRREQEILHFYKWWDELRLTRRFLDSCIFLYYDIFTISRI